MPTQTIRVALAAVPPDGADVSLGTALFSLPVVVPEPAPVAELLYAPVGDERALVTDATGAPITALL